MTIRLLIVDDQALRGLNDSISDVPVPLAIGTEELILRTTLLARA
jgi:hypothetical protein